MGNRAVSPSFIQELLVRADIVSLIDARISLKRSGNSYLARCPFHDDKTPSLSVSREKQFYHCFGCGASGNAISFLMNYNRLVFIEAVEVLADTVGLAVPSYSPNVFATSTHSVIELYDLQEEVCRFYQKQWKNRSVASDAIDYLKSRGVSGKIAQHYRLGYAPSHYYNFPTDFSKELLKKAGLLIAKGDNHSFDRFRDRIIFPIRDTRGRIVGFGGRTVGQKEGNVKYLNSPETPVFKKNKELYGLYELLHTIRNPESILVVEGYLDVIALVQSGIPNAVATLGTAVSTDHIKRLFCYTSALIFCFDGDGAGRKAAWKALEVSLPMLQDGRHIRFLELPEGYDPDSLLRAEGRDYFLKRVDNAQPCSDYLFARLSESVQLTTLEGRASLANSAIPLIEKLPPGMFKRLLQKRLKQLTDITPATSAISQKMTVSDPRASKGSTVPSAITTFLALLVQYPQLADHVCYEERCHLATLQTEGKFAVRILTAIQRQSILTSGNLHEFFRGEPDETQISRLINYPTHIDPNKIVPVFLDHLKYLTQDLIRERRLDELIKKSSGSELTQEECQELHLLTSNRTLPHI